MAEVVDGSVFNNPELKEQSLEQKVAPPEQPQAQTAPEAQVQQTTTQQLETQRQQLATAQLEAAQQAVPGLAGAEAVAGDRIAQAGNLFQKIFAGMETVKQWFQKMGAGMLRSFASGFRMVGWEGPARFLEMIAGEDKAELTDALKNANLTLVEPVLNPQDPTTQQRVTDFAARQRELFGHFATLTGYTKAQYYAGVVAAWRRTNPGKSQATIDELLTAARTLAVNNPTPTPAPAPATPENLAALPMLNTFTSDNLVNRGEVRINHNNQVVRLSVAPDKIMVNGVNYRLVAIPAPAAMVTLTSVVAATGNLTVVATVGGVTYPPQLLQATEVSTALTSLQSGLSPVTVQQLRFERM